VIRVEVNERLFRVRFVDLPLPSGAGRGAAGRPRRKKAVLHARRAPRGNDVIAPMHGVVVEIFAKQATRSPTVRSSR